MPDRLPHDPPPVPAEFVDFLKEHQTFYLFGHVEPDGDCICSSLALGSFLERSLGKRVRQYSVGPFDRREIAHHEPRFSDSVREEDRLNDARPAAIILDCSGPDRIGRMQSDIEGLPLAVIDHHATTKPFGDARFVVTTAAATCFLVQLVIEALGEEISADEADLLLFGIMTDTGYLRHLEAGSADLVAAVARLMAAGASPKRAHAQMFGGQTLESRQLLGSLISRMIPIAGGAGLLTWETAEDVKQFGKRSRDSDTLYQLLFGIDGIRTAAVIRPEGDDSVSGSLRSIDSIDVSEVAKKLGGGGHRRAAGFTARMPLDTAIERVRALLETAVVESTKTDQSNRT